jgi:transcriptional antiterminator Rof (Rho-off)
MSNDDVPIVCAVHDEIEGAILQRAFMQLCCEEYLAFRSGENIEEVRLDRIVEFSRLTKS